MTLQLPLLARIEQQQAAAAKARGAEAQPPVVRPLVLSNVPAGPLMGAGSPWIEQQQDMMAQQDLMAWLLTGPKDPSVLKLDQSALAAELNSAAERRSPAASCSDLVVPQAPGSPITTLHGFDAPTAALSSDTAAPLSMAGKRSREDFQGAIVPRSHRRKTQHPHRAPLDSEASPSPVPSSFHRVPRLSPAAEGRRQRSPDRIHPLHHMPAGGKSRVGAAAAAAAGSASPAAGTTNKECHDCHTLKTPMWRRVEGNTYCNACGLRRTRAMVGR